MFEIAVQALQGSTEGHVVLQCVYEDGTSEHRVCIFEDIVLWNGELLYFTDGMLVTMPQTPLETPLGPLTRGGKACAISHGISLNLLAQHSTACMQSLPLARV